MDMDKMDTDTPDVRKRPRLAEFAAVVALLGVALGFFIYQHGSAANVRSEAAQKSALSAPGAAAPGNAADAASNSGLQQLANAPTNSDSPMDPAAVAAQSVQSKSASLRARDIAYVQGRRANIRSEANAHGQLVGRAYKGTRLSVLSRSGEWVQVESGETKGWVSARLIGPRLR